MLTSIKAVGRLTILKVVGALISLLYSVLQVRFFGAEGSVDAFFVSTAALGLIMSLTQSGQIAEILLPEYIREKVNKGLVAASIFFSAVLNRMVLILIALLTVFYFSAPQIINVMGAGLASEAKTLSVALFRASLVLILFNVIAAFVNAILNAEQVYGRAEVTGVINSIISVVMISLFYKELGVWVLLFSLLIGKVVEFLLGLYFLKKAGVKYRFTLFAVGYDLNQFFKVLYTTFGYVSATQFFNVILTMMTSFLPEGTLSIFNYVKQLSSKSKDIILMPISTVFFSKFSEKVAEGSLRLVSYLKVPLIVLGIIGFLQFCFVTILGESFLKVLWGERNLSETEYFLAYIMLVLNVLGVYFSMVGNIFRKSAVALGGASQLYKLWTLGQVFCASYSYLVIHFFGIKGLATIPLVNMLLMNSISVYVAKEKGIRIRSIFQKIEAFKRLWIFIITGISITLLLLFSNITASTPEETLLIRLCVACLLFAFFAWALGRNELRSFTRFVLNRS